MTIKFFSMLNWQNVIYLNDLEAKKISGRNGQMYQNRKDRYL